MRTIELNDRGIVVNNGQISFIEDVNACRQDAISRVRQVQGEDFYDNDRGIPWFDESLAKVESPEVTKSRVRDALNNSNEVLSVLRVDFDYKNKQAELSATISSIYGVFEL